MQCILDEHKVCNKCGECDRCDLDPNKICDNCCKCLEHHDGAEYAAIPITDVVMEDEEAYLEEFYREEGIDESEDDERS